MTAPLARPDPYSLKPSKPGASRSRSQVSAPTAPARQAGQPVRELLRVGLRAMAHGHLEAARASLLAAASPESLASGNVLAIDALAYLSGVRWKLGEIETARADSEKALAMAPKRFAPNQNAGEMALNLGNPSEAAERFLIALRACEPGTADAKVAEACLKDARERTTTGIRHEDSFPSRPGGLLSWLTRARRNRPATSAAAEVRPES